MTMDWPEAEAHHAPSEPEPRRIIPERAMLWRGLALLGLALGAFAGARSAAPKSPWLGATVAPVLGLAGMLAAWAAAIHLSGGEKFDDNPWV